MDALKWLATQLLDASDDEEESSDDGEAEESEEPAARQGKQVHKLQQALAQPLVDKRALADVVWLGVPQGLDRCKAWQMLLGYRPLSQERRSNTLKRKRKEYQDLRHELLERSPALNASAAGSWEPLGEAEESVALHQIRRDLPRLVLCGSAASAAGEPLARLQELIHEPRIHGLMERVLVLWAVKQPAAGYVQGHHDVLLLLLLVFLADCAGVSIDSGLLGIETLDKLGADVLEDLEADCFWCLSKLLGEVADFYTEGQPGLQRGAVLLRSLLAGADAELLENLEAEGIQIPALVQRWLGCLLVRELPMPLCARLWDTCLAELVLLNGGGLASFLVHFCAGFLVWHAEDLRDAPFDELMEFVQKPPTEDICQGDLEALISEAYVLRSGPTRSASDGHAATPGVPGAPSSTRTTSGSPASTPRCWSSQASEAEDAELLQPPPPPQLLPANGMGMQPGTLSLRPTAVSEENLEGEGPAACGVHLLV